MPLAAQQVFQPVSRSLSRVYEDGGADFRARVYGHAGALLQQATVSTITGKVFDLDSATPTTAVYTPTLVVATQVFDTLQTDGTWTLDTTGYNFAHAMPADAFPTGNHRYRVEYKITPTGAAGSAVIWVTFDVKAVRVLS